MSVNMLITNLKVVHNIDKIINETRGLKKPYESAEQSVCLKIKKTQGEISHEDCGS